MLRTGLTLFFALTMFGGSAVSATAAGRKAKMTPAEAERQVRSAAGDYLECLTNATLREVKRKTPRSVLMPTAIKSCDKTYASLETLLIRFGKNVKTAKQQARKIKSEALLTLATALAEASTSKEQGVRGGAASGVGSTFDGKWIINAECQELPPNVAKATWKANATIKDGKLSAEWGDRGKAGSGKFEGIVQSNGALEIVAQGLTGDRRFSSNNAPENTPYTWKAIGSLSGETGTVSKIEGRYCVLQLAKTK